MNKKRPALPSELHKISYLGTLGIIAHALGLFVVPAALARLTQARTRTSPFFTALFLGTNYHLEHHLYPSVPCYRLPRVHRILQEQGLLSEAHVETTIRGAYRHATAMSQYPHPNAA